MDSLAWPGSLEIRRAGGRSVLRGVFPYGGTAVLADRGTVRKERIILGAFDYSLDDPDARIDLLVGHDWGKPVASRQSGTLDIRAEGNAVIFDAVLPDDPPSWVSDAEKAILAGVMTGLSPGMRVPPLGVVPGAERTIPEPGNPGVSIREVHQAVLREMSIVTSAGYLDAGVELRADELAIPVPFIDNRGIFRWL